jgi:hypothetical protein
VPARQDPIPQSMRDAQDVHAEPTFEELAAAVARSQGGRVSIRQLQAIARITGGGMPADRYGYALPAPDLATTGSVRSLRSSPGSGDVDGSIWRRELERSASRDPIARRGLDEDEEARASSADRLNARNGQPMISVGDGFTSNGSYYVGAGPDGAVNARTGEYMPLVNGM